MLLIALRVVHVVGGVFWAGAMLFVVFFLEPAVRAAGPDGVRVMQGLRKRRYLEVVPADAVLTLLSGLALYWRDFGRLYPGPGASRAELTLGIGGAAALVALVVGVTVLRPSALRMGALGAELSRSAPERQEELGAEIGRLRPAEAERTVGGRPPRSRGRLHGRRPISVKTGLWLFFSGPGGRAAV